MFESEIKIVDHPIGRDELREFLGKPFADLVKAVVDVERGIMALGGDLHADEETVLLAGEAKQQNLWGINLYPEKTGDDFIEFDSMINLRPWQGNRSRGVEDQVTQQLIKRRSWINW